MPAPGARTANAAMILQAALEVEVLVVENTSVATARARADPEGEIKIRKNVVRISV